MTSLRHLRSSTADKRPDPAAMVDGQLAMNYDIASPGLFFKDDNGTLIKVGPVHVGTTAPNVSPAAGGTAGNSIGEQWLDTTSGVYVLKVWDGSAWRSESGTFVDVSGDTMTGALTMANQGAVRFSETTANGSNYIALQANAALASNKTITLPDTTGTVVTTGDTGTVTSTMIADGTILNADVNASAAIAGSKISPDFGSQTVATTGILSTGTGSAAAPSIAFTGDTNTGIYSPGADQLAVSTGGTGRLFVDSSGRVGIGTSSPTAGYLLDCRGNVKFGSPSTAGVYLGVDSNIPFIQGFDSGATYNQLKFLVGATEAARIDSSGRVGIGTSSPAAKTEIVTTTNGDGLRLSYANTPTGGTGASLVFANNNNAATLVPLASVKGIMMGGAVGSESGDLTFNTATGGAAPTERMRITNTGEIWTGSSTVQRYNNITCSLWGYDPGAGAGAGVMVFVNFGTAGNGSYQGVGLSKSATSWGTYSDERGKTNLAPIENGLSKVSNLRAVTGRYLDDEENTRRSFLIAQDVQDVLPEAVDAADPDKLSLRYTEVIPLLVAALKESKERIETLEAAVAALQGA